MKIVKHYWFIAIALITMISFSSCESDEERGFDISGLYGKTWWGEMGFEDPYGERLYSYITFTSGAFPDHGVGTEERCYYDDELYRVYKFDWEIQNGWLYLYYSDGYTFIIEYPSVSGRYFYGTWKSHATLTLLATQDLPTFGYNMIDPLKSWCWGSILFYPFKISRFS